MKVRKRQYRKTNRRQGDIANQRELRFRFASEEERAFVEEAARAGNPIPTNRALPRFLADAALKQAESVLRRPRPVPDSEPVAVPA